MTRLPDESLAIRPPRLSIELQSTLLLLGLMGISAAVGFFLFGVVGLVAGGLAVAALSFLGVQIPDHLIMRLNGALPLARHAAPGLQRITALLARRAGIPQPRLYLIPSGEANALSVGSSDGQGSVALTAGLLRLLDDSEIEAVLAHEIAHLVHRDTAVLHLSGLISRIVLFGLTMAVWLTGVLFLLGSGSVSGLLHLAVLALGVPLAIMALQAALSRTREFAADETAARLTGRPRALARALARLARQRHALLRLIPGTAGEPPLLRSHPATRARIQRLLALAGPEPAPRLPPALRRPSLLTPPSPIPLP